MILRIFPGLLLACSMKSSVASEYHSLASSWITLPFWTGKSWKLFQILKHNFACFKSCDHLGHVSYQNSQWPDLRRMKPVISWHSSLHRDTRSAAQCGAVPGQQPTLLLGAGAIKAEMSLSPELDLAHWPVSASARCVLREALGRSPSQGSPPSPTPLLSQSPTVWPNRMVWGTWAPHAESSAQWGCRSCWQPWVPPQDSSDLFCLSSGTCFFSTMPCSLSDKVLQILALRFHFQLHLP